MTSPVGFDLDLTLIDSRVSILAAFRALSEATGTTIDFDAVEARLGLKLEDELGHWFAVREVASAAAIYRRHYVELARTSTPVMPGAHEALAAVAAGGNQSVIITAKHESSVAPCLEAAGLCADQLFAFVHGPEKAVVLRRIRASIYVGDTPSDMQAAHDAGVVGVGVPTGSFNSGSLVDAGARVVLSSLEHFPAWYHDFLAA